jgi:hypothetical protein
MRRLPLDNPELNAAAGAVAGAPSGAPTPLVFTSTL